MRTKPIDEVVAQQVRFSSRAFGPGPRTEGLRLHILKELAEIQAAPKDILEWIDVIILGLDGAWRCAAAQHPWLNEVDLGKFVADALLHKISVNEQREWPDWREAGQDQPIEHVRAVADALRMSEKAAHILRERTPGEITGSRTMPDPSNHNHQYLGELRDVCGHCIGRGLVPDGQGSEMTCAFCRGMGIVGDKQ